MVCDMHTHAIRIYTGSYYNKVVYPIRFSFRTTLYITEQIYLITLLELADDHKIYSIIKDNSGTILLHKNLARHVQ